MSISPEIITYIWLLPVVTQIALPLIMLVVWLIGKPVYRLVFKQTDSRSPLAHLPGGIAKKSI